MPYINNNKTYMNILRDTFYRFDPKFMKRFGDDFRYESEFETPSTQRMWIISYFFLAVACLFLSPLLILAIVNAPKKNVQLENFFYGVAITFALVGIYSFIQGIWTFYKKKIIDKLKTQHPTEPWKWRIDWAKGIIYNKKKTSSAWIIAILYNLLFTLPAILAIATNDYGFFLFLVVISGLLLVGVSLFVYAFMQTLRTRKFGASICKPSILPIKPGVEVQYNIHIPVKLVGINKIQSRIFCYETEKTASDEQQVLSMMCWEECKDIPLNEVQINNTQTIFTVAYVIKPEVQPTMITDETIGVVWFLEVKAQTEGLDYKVLFEIPVFTSAIDLSHVLIEGALMKASMMIRPPMVYIAISIIVVLCIVIMLWNPIAPEYIGAVGFIIGLPLAWLWRSIMITKWKIWAYKNVDDVRELKKRAIEQNILYPDNHFLTRTEIRTRSQAEQLARLELKFRDTNIPSPH
jgi:hypothetical protein